MRFLITGMAGFIGFHLAKKLLDSGHSIVGIDSVNDYYSPDLKFARLGELGIARDQAEEFGRYCSGERFGENLHFIRMKLEDRQALPELFRRESFDVVCNLAAQAGVRYSLENPMAYVDSNVVGFVNLLECCRHFQVGHLVFASSSSVYGQNETVPFEVVHNVDHPISLYAATKKSNELMAYTYSHLYGFHTTGLRFFTVYGPWGRPDMALFLFTKAILNGEPINVFNHGQLERDFTYIDDIVEGIFRVATSDLNDRKEVEERYRLYNIGNGKSVNLMAFISEIEAQLGRKAEKKMLPMQPGDVSRTWASTEGLQRDFDYRPETPIGEGVRNFVQWYKDYYE